MAQDNGASVYDISDVAVDVTADSAAHARDQAIMQAQRTAFDQLMERLGVEPGSAGKLSDDDIATLVQNFEVQNEHASAVRYIGTFTVQFRPNAVRSLLGEHGSSFTETQSKPVVILPVFIKAGTPVLWEEPTLWRAAWLNSTHVTGLVPVFLPDDVKTVSTADAVSGKADAIKMLIDKYQAGGAAVATLNADLDKLTGDFKIDVTHYDADGHAWPTVHITLTPPADKNLLANFLMQAVKKVRQQLEKDWRQGGEEASSTPAIVPEETTSDQGINRLPVTIPIGTLAQWAQIRRRIENTSGVNHVDVITLERGMASIEVDFHGGIPDLQLAMLQQNLILKQDGIGGGWTVRPANGAL